MRAGDVRTVLAHRLHRPHGSATDWPYYRAIELAMLGIARRYGVTFPTADSFSMIELGVADGTSFEQMLRFRDVLQRVIGVRQPVTCVGFDTFEGLPAERAEDEAVPWAEGDFAASVEQVRHRLEGFDGFELAQGLFADTLPEWRERLEREPPIFISVDCDYYSSTMDAFDVLMPLAPTGCLVYLDDVAAYYWSDKAGELKAVREVNDGRYGEHISLAEYPLHVETGQARHFRQLWRVVNLEKGGFPSGSYLLADIRSAETARELLLYVRNFHSDAAEFRNLVNLIETEISSKIEQFAQEADVVAQAPRVVPSKDAEG